MSSDVDLRPPDDTHRALGLTDDEYLRIGETLGRHPNHLELAMYSVMWSEHCSYKSSRIHLRRFPTEAPWVLVGPGEGAGVVDVGDGIAAALRIASHNHPSAIEPYQGAATGVGGIQVKTTGIHRLGNLCTQRTRLPLRLTATSTTGHTMRRVVNLCRAHRAGDTTLITPITTLLDPGTYTLTARTQGFHARKTVTVTKNTTTRTTVRLANRGRG